MEVLVAQLEREAHQLEQDGDDIRAIRMMERALAQRITARMNGSIPAAERLVVKYNTVAVRCFKNDDFEAAQTLLNSALELTNDGSVIFLESDNTRIRLRGTTLNNFGCLERRRGNMPAAAGYLKQSIEHGGQESPASFLNLSAVLTNLGRYTDAVAWCRRAIAMLENQQNQNMITSSEDDSTQNQEHQQQQQKKSDAPGLMAIAYHNLASPLEQLDRAAAIAAYRKALEIARTEIGQNSSTTRSIQMSLDRFLKMPPAQVTTSGGVAAHNQQLQASQQLAAASGDLSAANKRAAHQNQNPSMPGSFLPPVGGSSASTAVKGATTKFGYGSGMPSARSKAAALAAARRKPDYMNRNISRSSNNSTPTSTAQHQHQPIRPSPRKLSPIGGARRDSSGTPTKRAAAATPPKFMTEREGRTKSGIRERTAAKIAEERDGRSRAEPMAKSGDRNFSRTPPVKRHSKSDNDQHPRFSQSARAGGASTRDERRNSSSNGRPPRPQSTEKISRTTRRESSNESGGDKTTRRRDSSRQPVPPSHQGNSTRAERSSRNNNNDNNSKPSSSSMRGGRGAAASTRNRRESTAEGSDRKAKSTNDGSSPSPGRSMRNNNEKQFSRAVEKGSGTGNPVKDLEEEISKKDDIVSFMVARLAALLRAEEDFERCYIAVCRIQCLFRRVRAKTRVQGLRQQRELAATYRQARENTAARTLVRFFRKLVAQKQEAILQELRDEEIRALNDIAAAKIQRVSRMWLARRELMRKRADARLHYKALRVLQCWFRKLLAQRLADRLRETKKETEAEKLHLERREFAATQIQRIFLGRRDALKIHRIRRSMRMLREKEMESRRTSSAKRIQAVWRGFLGRQIARGKRSAAENLRLRIERWELVQRSIKFIQAWTRGTLTRLRSAPELAVFRQNQVKHREAFRHHAASKINSVVRGFLARCTVKRAIADRTAQQRLEWFKFLLPNVQGYCRARTSISKVSKKMYAFNHRQAQLQIDFARQLQQLEQSAIASAEENVSQEEIAERKKLAIAARTEWTQIRAVELKDAERYEELQRQLAEEAERKRQQDVEIATAAPVQGDRKRPGKMASELKIGYESQMVEIDEDDADAKRIFDAQEQRRQEQERAAKEERLRNAPARAPFYNNSTSTTSGIDGGENDDENNKNNKKIPRAHLPSHPKGGLFVNPQYAENPHRGLSVPIRETMRKQELSKRTKDRLASLSAEEEERKRVLAEASGMKVSAAEAVSRAGAVVNEPMPQVEQTHFVDEYERQQQQERSKRQQQKQQQEENELAGADDQRVSPSRRTLTKQSVQSPESKHNEWEDFSKLDQFTTAHRDEVLNTLTRRSVAIVQTCLRTRSSAALADKKAAIMVQKLPLLKKSASTVSAFLNSAAATEEFKKKEQLTELRLRQQLHSVETENNAVLLIQSFSRAHLSSRSVAWMKALSVFQERNYASSRIQAVVREKQARPHRLAHLRRENLQRRSENISETKLEQQIRDYAARIIQAAVRAKVVVKNVSVREGIVDQKRAERRDRQTVDERSCTSLVRAFAARILQRFFRNSVRHTRACTKRRKDIGRRAQVNAGLAFEQERDIAVRMIQYVARLYIQRQLRRRGIALSDRRVYETSRQLDFERNYAVIKIQSSIRGYLAKKCRRELEGEKSRKWAGLLDEELEQQQQSRDPSSSPARATTTIDSGAEKQVGVCESDGKTAIMGVDRNSGGVDFAAADAAAVAASQQEDTANTSTSSTTTSDGADTAAAEEQEQKEAAIKIQCAFRVGAAKRTVEGLKEEKKAEWERLAEEAAAQEQEL